MIRTGALRALGAVALAFMLTGCLKLDMAIEIQDDETVDGRVIVGIARGIADLSGQEPEAISEQLQDEMMADAPDGVTAEPYEDDDYVGTEMRFDGVALDDVDLGDGGDDALTIVHEGDEYVLSGAFDLTDDEFADLGGDAGFLEGFAGSIDVHLEVTFPGEVIEHNGELDGRTVTWVPEVGERLELQARARDGGGASFPWLIVAVLAGLAVIGAGALVVWRLRGGTGPGDEEATDLGPGAAPADEVSDTRELDAVQPETALPDEPVADGTVPRR